MQNCSSRITKETLHWAAPNKRKEIVVDITNTYYKNVIFCNFEVLFFEQTGHFKERGCLKFWSFCVKEYYITILLVI